MSSSSCGRGRSASRPAMIPAVYLHVQSRLLPVGVPAAWQPTGSAGRGSFSLGSCFLPCLFRFRPGRKALPPCGCSLRYYGLFMGLTEGVQKAFLATIIPAGIQGNCLRRVRHCRGLSHVPCQSHRRVALGPFLPRSHLLFRCVHCRSVSAFVSRSHRRCKEEPRGAYIDRMHPLGVRK